MTKDEIRRRQHAETARVLALIDATLATVLVTLAEDEAPMFETVGTMVVEVS